jgi:hypothetical protein
MWLTGSAWEGDVGSSLYPSFVYIFIAAVLAYSASKLLDMYASSKRKYTHYTTLHKPVATNLHS